MNLNDSYGSEQNLWYQITLTQNFRSKTKQCPMLECVWIRDLVWLIFIFSCSALTTKETSGNTSERRKTCESLTSKQTETSKFLRVFPMEWKHQFPNNLGTYFIDIFHDLHFRHRLHHRPHENQFHFRLPQRTIFERRNTQVHLDQVRENRKRESSERKIFTVNI